MTPPERATEVVLLIVIVMNVFFVLAALVQPLVVSRGAKSAHARAVAPTLVCKDGAEATRAARIADPGAPSVSACRRA